jgi:DNA-binding transcriptional ArsR family regulator
MSALLDLTKALADETRHEIMGHLCCRWLSVNEVVEQLGGRVGQPTVSHHLKQLDVAGLVLSRRDGRRRLYTLDQRRVCYCCDQLMEQFAPEFTAAESPAHTQSEACDE